MATKMPPPQPQRSGFRGVYIGLVLFVLIAAAAGGYVFYKIGKMQTPVDHDRTIVATTTPEIVAAYRILGGSLTRQPGDPNLVKALETFRAIAADESKSNRERAQALNGINYAYTQSDFDAKTIYDVVFSKAPFNGFYVESTSTKPDIVHPQSGSNVQDLESALIKINTLSNALYPNHYAISRLERNLIFASARETDGLSVKKKREVQKEYAKKVQPLIEAYDAVSADDLDMYSTAMRLHTQYAHAGNIAFVGRTLDDDSLLQKGEKLFQETIALGDSYPKSNPNATRILNETLLARIFYATQYWSEYKTTDPNRIFNILKPLTDVEAIKATTVYKFYLPSHKEAKDPTFTILRQIAEKMPELKALFVSLGYKF